MTITDRKKLVEVLAMFRNITPSGVFKILSMDSKNDLDIVYSTTIQDGSSNDLVMADKDNFEYPSFSLHMEVDESGSLNFMESIHELLVLNINYVMVRDGRKSYHTYAGCSIKTYPGTKGLVFLNFRDNSGVPFKGIPIQEIKSVSYKESTKSLTVTYVDENKPSFTYSWRTVTTKKKGGVAN